MSRSIQLRIPRPCEQHWANMQPTETGRHCQSCCKTVVDFTAMSDTEILRHLGQAGPGVCGRFAPDQLNRSLASLSPPQKNGWSGWKWLLAGAMITSNKSAPDGPTGPGIRQHQVLPSTHKPHPPGAMVGMVLTAEVLPPLPEQKMRVLKDCVATEIVHDGTVMGEPALNIADSLFRPRDLAPDSPALTATPLPDPKEDLAFTGGILLSSSKTSPLQPTIDSIRQIVADTLTFLHLLPKKGLTIYPNPVRQGALIRLSGLTEPGKYHLTLLTATGMLIQERVLEVNSLAQVDVWNIPSRLPAGIYILRAFRPGQTGGSTRELLVE